MVVSFAHGSNDVGNAVGPYAAIQQIWNSREVTQSAKVPTWMYALGECDREKLLCYNFLPLLLLP